MCGHQLGCGVRPLRSEADLVTNGAGDKFSLTEGDGLIVEVKISGLRRVSSGFFPALEVGGIEFRRE